MPIDLGIMLLYKQWLKLCIKCLEDKMVNKILSMYILEEMPRISESKVIREVLEFTIKNYSNIN